MLEQRSFRSNSFLYLLYIYIKVINSPTVLRPVSFLGIQFLGGFRICLILKDENPQFFFLKFSASWLLVDFLLHVMFLVSCSRFILYLLFVAYFSL